jgi:hypothetical protein
MCQAMYIRIVKIIYCSVKFTLFLLKNNILLSMHSLALAKHKNALGICINLGKFSYDYLIR